MSERNLNQTSQTPVLIIGCGPIGIAGALLLSRFGINSILVERRGELNTHPRSRFVDTNTMELMREFGVEKEVEATGLKPDWTEYNRWLATLSGDEIAAIPSPTFHTVPRKTSPCLPVMTCQDYIENILIDLVKADPRIDLRFNTEVVSLDQDEDGVLTTLRNTVSGEQDQCASKFVIGADGPGSFTRRALEIQLDAEPREGFLQDVIFDADLSEWVGERKGALLYTMSPEGVVIFQPLNGVRRWRCQIGIQGGEPLTEEEAIERIRAACGASMLSDIKITSMSQWQPTPGLATRFAQGRVFLAGDAAHVSVPAGGMGNNAGFAGIRNLTWKLAFVLNGISPLSILDTYEIEHRPIAQERVDMGVKIYEAVVPIFVAHYSGQDPAETSKAAWFYADYDGVILGFEMSSNLIANEQEKAPEPTNAISDFLPLVRNGRRLPHAWLDNACSQSTLDWLGTEYVLIVGAAVDPELWQPEVARLADTGLPIVLKALPAMSTEAPFTDDMLVLVRPDGIIADHWLQQEVAPDERSTRLQRHTQHR